MAIVEPSRWIDNVLIIQSRAGVIQVPYSEVPDLITQLRRTYNARPGQQVQSEADGVVASVLLQSAVAEAPGDFS